MKDEHQQLGSLCLDMISTLKLLQPRCLQAALNQVTCTSAILVIRTVFSYGTLPVLCMANERIRGFPSASSSSAL